MSDSTSGGVTLTSDSTHIGGDVTGRDKIRDHDEQLLRRRGRT